MRRIMQVICVAIYAAALVWLGMPSAYAALTAPTISPNSGPVGCVVVISGSDFNNPNVNSVVFLGGAGGGDNQAAIFQIRSATEIWTTVTAAAVNGPIRLTNTAADTAETPAFTVPDPGNCAPTISSFTPTCGPQGTDVTVTGTNLLGSSGGSTGGSTPPAAAGGAVRFAPYGGAATATSTAPTPTSLSVNVNAGALDGPIKVTTFGALNGSGTATSTESFDVGTCITSFTPSSGGPGTTVTITGVGFEGATQVTFAGAGATRVQAIFQITSNTETSDTIMATVPVGAIAGKLEVVALGGTATSTAAFQVGGDIDGRFVTLKLKGKLRMKGKVGDPFAECTTGVSVKLQRKKKGGGWNTLKTVITSDTGSYSGKVKNKSGKYRSLAPATTAPAECLKAKSPVRKN